MVQLNDGLLGAMAAMTIQLSLCLSHGAGDKAFVQVVTVVQCINQ